MEPSLNSQKNSDLKKDNHEEFEELDNNQSKKIAKEKFSDINIHSEVHKEDNSTSLKSENFDLFNNNTKNKTEDHQIDLTEIEQESKEIDEKVLEIPAFLRRQAN